VNQGHIALFLLQYYDQILLQKVLVTAV